MSSPVPPWMVSRLRQHPGNAESPFMQQVQEAVRSLGRLDEVRRQALLSLQIERSQIWGPALSQLMRETEAAQEARRSLLAEAVEQWTPRIREAALASGQFSALSTGALARVATQMQTSGIGHLLDDSVAERELSQVQRSAAVAVVEEAYSAAGTVPEEDTPEEMVAEFAEQAQEFARVSPGSLSPAVQKQLFMYFCGLLVLFAMMQASFTSDTADAVMGKAIEYSTVAVLVMAAAGKGWDRCRGPADSAGQGDGGDSEG
ncbi:hypothetical protein ACWD3J_48190 [Streptomyces sp. NPDC002755]|uniref:hypothetical protein n=1 Tax=Streptomyces sp. NPDC002884 TaxID=3154544 RepID=UPI00332CF2F7